MKLVKYFKALKQTHRFNKNQKIWVRFEYTNHLQIWFKWRGKGRYVLGYIDKYDPNIVGEMREIEVNNDFADRVRDTSHNERAIKRYYERIGER